MTEAEKQLRAMVLRRWHLSDAQAAEISGADDGATWVRLAALSIKLGALFGERGEAERAWLATPRFPRGLSAMDILRQPDGLNRVEAMLRDETS